MKLHRALIAASILASLGIARGQPSAIQQLQNMQQQQLQMPQPALRSGTNAPELYTGENADIGPQRILSVGANGKAPRRKFLDGQADTQMFYSDNASYNGSHNRIGSMVFVNSVQAAIAPDPYDVGAGKFAPAVGFSSQWYNYNDVRMNGLDFNAQTAFANFRYLTGYWQFSLGANFTRLSALGSYDETYREWLPNLTVQRALPINDKMAFVVGDAVSYHFTTVPQLTLATLPPIVAPLRDDINDHLDNTLFVSLNWQLTPQVVIQPFYRFQYSWYKNASTMPGTIRNDYLNAFGITLLYSINENLSLRTFCSYTTKSSDDQNTPTYDEFNGGIGAMLDIRF
jgi:hypothetical protein